MSAADAVAVVQYRSSSRTSRNCARVLGMCAIRLVDDRRTYEILKVNTTIKFRDYVNVRSKEYVTVFIFY